MAYSDKLQIHGCTHTAHEVLTKVPKQLIVFSTTGYPYGNKYTSTPISRFTQLNYIKMDLRPRAKPIKLLEENMEENLCDIE